MKELHDEADYQFGLWIKSEGDPEGVNSGALFAYKDRWKDITDLMQPGDYPVGFANYGQALGQVSMFYKTLADLHERDLKEADASEKAAIQTQLEKSRSEALKYCRMSNRQLEIAFSASQQPLDARYYRWALGNCEYLKDWRNALRYLDLFESTGSLTDQGKLQVAELRKEYGENQRRLDEDQLDNELNRGQTERARGAKGREKADSAN